MKEKSADEMFEELGYKKEKKESGCLYKKECSQLHYTEYYEINFFNKEKWIHINNPWENKIEIQELQAINKKVKELRLV